MQGLLDFVRTPEGQGLLSAVAGGMASARRGAPVNSIGRGLLAGVQGYGNALDRQQQEQDSAVTRQFRDLQIKSAQQQMKDRELQAASLDALNPQLVATQTALAGGGGPTVANASKIQPVDPMRQQLFGLVRSGAIPVSEYLKMTGPKETKVKDYQQVRNADGTVSIVGLTEDGRVVNTSQTPFVKPEVRDFGGSIRGIDPVTGQVVTYGDKTISPDAKASNAVSWANVNLARERLNFDKTAPRGVLDPERGLLVDPRTGEARPVTMDGKPVAPKQSSEVKKEILSINQQRAAIDGAIEAVKKTPSGFSLGRGVAGSTQIGESLAGRTESKDETIARGYVFNNVSRIINERAGAAQSAQELARLNSFLPATTDNAEQIVNKLEGFKQYLIDMERGTLGGGASPPAAPRGDFKILSVE